MHQKSYRPVALGLGFVIAATLLLTALSPSSPAATIRVGQQRAVRSSTESEWTWGQYISHSDAVEAVIATGGAVKSCQRRAPRHFHCVALWWFEQHEAELEPDGTLVNETTTYFAEEGTCEVGLKGARINWQSLAPPANTAGS